VLNQSAARERANRGQSIVGASQILEVLKVDCPTVEGDRTTRSAILKNMRDDDVAGARSVVR
jgi:hypothetical protein